eukprot:scaffold38171_cov73-Cyclotella_meneghiniana.AAC.1
MNLLKDDPELILDPLFMNNIFKKYRDELPPFTEYWDLMFKKKQMKVVARKDGSKVVHYNRLRKYLFNPTRATDKETTDTVIELASTAVEAVITELEDKRKATFNCCKCQKNQGIPAQGRQRQVQEAIDSVAMQDAPQTRKRNNADLEIQAKKARKQKEDMLREL